MINNLYGILSSSSGRAPEILYEPNSNWFSGFYQTEEIQFYSKTIPEISYTGTLAKGLYYTLVDLGSDNYSIKIQGIPVENYGATTDIIEFSISNSYGITYYSYKTLVSSSSLSVSGSDGSYLNYSGSLRIYYKIYSGTLTFTGNAPMNFILVGGGGGGASDGNGGGGGGSGGVIYGRIGVAGSYTVLIGPGGSAGASSNTSGSNGSPSRLYGSIDQDFIAYGGGGGAKFGSSGLDGGNGGGAGAFNSNGGTGSLGGDGGSGVFFNGGGGGSGRSDINYYIDEPSDFFRLSYDGKDGGSDPNETGGNGGEPVIFYDIWQSTSSYWVGGGGGGGGGFNGGISYSGGASHSGGRGVGANVSVGYGNGIASPGLYYGQGGGGGYYSGGRGADGVLLFWF